MFNRETTSVNMINIKALFVIKLPRTQDYGHTKPGIDHVRLISFLTAADVIKNLISGFLAGHGFI